MKPAIRRAVEKAVADLPITNLVFEDAAGHTKLSFTYQGRIKVLTVSGTPSEIALCAKEVVRDIKRFMRGQYK